MECQILKLSSFLVIALSLSNLSYCFAQQELEYRLQISPTEKALSKPSNHRFVLTCRGQGGNALLFSDIKWYTPQNEEIRNDSPNLDIRRNYQVLSRDGNVYLHFMEPRPEVSGTYECRSLLQGTEVLRAKIDINVYEDVTWDQCKEVQYLILGNVGERINCKASANPKPNIIWNKIDSGSLDNNPRYSINSSGIVIKGPVVDEDGGQYQVNAFVTETGATHEKRITVQIYSRPAIVHSVEKANGTEDDQIELKCEATGSPQPLFSWFDGNKRNLSTVGGYAVDRNTGSVIVRRLRKNQDEGNFTCIAENYAGKAESVTQLTVFQRPVIREFVNVSFDVRTESYLECRATGYPLPKLTIRQNGKSREFIVGDPRIKLESREEKRSDGWHENVLLLTFLETTRKDDGLYYCRAENGAGFVEKAGHLTVKFPPDMSATPLTKIKTWDSRPVNISCIADAIPNATIKWFKQATEIYPSNVYRIADSGTGISKLFIQPTKLTYDDQVFGTYRCEGSNSLGKNDINIDLERATIPATVAGIQSIENELTPTSVRFKINNELYDGGMPIKKIIVQYYNQNDPSDRELREFPYSKIENLYIIDRLKPFTAYVFRFLAENEVGKGEYGQEIRIRTKKESPPEKPEFHNLSFDDVNKNEVVAPFPNRFTATWNLPANNGKKIKYFEVKYYEILKTEYGFEPMTQPKIEQISQLHDEMTTITLTKLRANAFYRIELRAYNDLGFSEPATLVFRTPAGSASVDFEDDAVRISGFPLWFVATIVILIISILLVLMDVFFYVRYNVGAMYFLKTHCCGFNDDDQGKVNFNSPNEIRYSGRNSTIALHRAVEAQNRQAVEIDNPAFDVTPSPPPEEKSPMLTSDRYSGYPSRRSDLDSAV